MLTRNIPELSVMRLVDVSSVAPHWLQGKCAKIHLSQAPFGMILQDQRQLPVCYVRVKIAALGSLKRVTESIFKISK
jgi:hypothetical protein